MSEQHMKRVIPSSATICFFWGLFACNKPKNNPVQPVTVDSTFIHQLENSCTQPFVALGDSGTYALPTAFSPNDDGVNDEFYLLGYPYTFTTYQLAIYKTNGTKVFLTTDPHTHWNGRDTANTKCTDYKYFVKIKYTTPGARTVDTGTYLFLLGTGTGGCTQKVTADLPLYKFPDQYNGTGGFTYPTYENFCP